MDLKLFATVFAPFSWPTGRQDAAAALLYASGPARSKLVVFCAAGSALV
jgi:hypothetical protein